jgi:hypothetical protein
MKKRQSHSILLVSDSVVVAYVYPLGGKPRSKTPLPHRNLTQSIGVDLDLHPLGVPAQTKRHSPRHSSALQSP